MLGLLANRFEEIAENSLYVLFLQMKLSVARIPTLGSTRNSIGVTN